jgi:transposase
MRERFSKDKNSKIYKQRAHAIESPFGQIKHNLKYRIFMRRSQDKVKMEITLLAILHNIMKIRPQMALT